MNHTNPTTHTDSDTAHNFLVRFSEHYFQCGVDLEHQNKRHLAEYRN